MTLNVIYNYYMTLSMHAHAHRHKKEPSRVRVYFNKITSRKTSDHSLPQGSAKAIVAAHASTVAVVDPHSCDVAEQWHTKMPP